MKKQLIQATLFFSMLFCFTETTAEEKMPIELSEVTFIPPNGWKNGDISKMSPVVKSMIVGTGKNHFPPTLTLAIEPYHGNLKEYLKIVKNINEKERTDWKDLGKISTKAGEGSLSQFDEKSKWGEVRTMTAILVKDGNAYILSATALKEEFSNSYKDFFQAMRSLDITKTVASHISEKS